MPYTKEQLRTYWATNKAVLNEKRREKRRLARLAMIKLAKTDQKRLIMNRLAII